MIYQIPPSRNRAHEGRLGVATFLSPAPDCTGGTNRPPLPPLVGDKKVAAPPPNRRQESRRSVTAALICSSSYAVPLIRYNSAL